MTHPTAPDSNALLRLSPRDWRSHPAYLYDAYRSTAKRGPQQPPLPLLPVLPVLSRSASSPPSLNLAAAALNEMRRPVYGHDCVGQWDHDLTRNARRNGEPIGERMVLAGRVLDDRGRPVPHTLVEIWQANAAGRYVHKVDQHDAPLDPNFLGAGRCLTDSQGHYRFLTIKPGAYPWGNHPNAWRPQHIHLSLFGQHFASRLVTQMYFPGDPLLPYDPMISGTPAHARSRLVADFSLDLTQEGYALGYQFDIVLRGVDETPFEHR